MYKQRRDWLFSQLGNNAVAIIVGNTQKTRSKNIKYHFRPDNDLFYFTGFTEADAVCVFRPGHDDSFVMFNRPKDAAAETSFGERAGQEGACSKYGSTSAYPINEFEDKLPELLEERTNVYYLDEQDVYSAKIVQWLNQQRRTTGFDIIKQHRNLLPLAPIVHNNRVVKTDDEIQLMRHAVKASVSAHKKVMQACKPGKSEFQMEAEFNREIAEFGCREVSYPSIVASGNNACCLHYEENCCDLNEGEMLLIDAGAEYQFYCADITRTYPINGKFTNEQTALYNIVLKALDAAIAKVEPGLPWNVIYETCARVMAEGLIEIGLLSGTIDEVMESGSHKEFTVHKTGHWLGMDVHDVGSYHDEHGEWVTLKPNMVFTIEPGIYIPKHFTHVDEKWRGIGIRIEDDILVTESGHENLSAGVPRTIEEIETLMSE